MWNTPSLRLSIIFAMGLIATIASVKVAMLLPRTNSAFAEGDTIHSSSTSVTLESIDLIPEPGEISDDAVLTRFYDRQNQIAHILSSEQIKVTQKNHELSVMPQPGHPLDLHHMFWIQLIVGIGALIISGWVWALKPQGLPSRLFFLSGIATLTFTFSAAIYTTRELAIHSSLFQALTSLNAFGASLFGIAMVALFLLYPTVLKNWLAVLVMQVLFFGAWTTLSILGLLPVALGVNLITLSEMLCICVAIGVQFFATKGNPQARAALTWLGLAVLFGAGGFIFLNATPLVLGVDAAMSQGYAFLFFLVIYVGLAAGITRYRLFEVGRWAFRLLFYSIGALFVVLTDGALIFFLGMDRFPALGASLLAVSLLYLPIRDYIWRKLQRRKKNLEPHELIAEAMHVAFAATTADRVTRWKAFLQRAFDPLEITLSDSAFTVVTIKEDGLILMLPSLAGETSLKLSYASSGKALFSAESKDLANHMVSLIQHAESNREAYDRGVVEERKRIAQDLHDDVGARLLTGLHKADDAIRPIFQDALADIRTIVSGIAGEKVTLNRLLADLRHETARRLAATSITLDWPTEESPDLNIDLDYQRHKTIRSATREIVSNLIRHSKADKFIARIAVKNKTIILDFEDNGKGFTSEALDKSTSTHGLKILHQRCQTIGGEILFENAEPGTRTIITFSI